MKTTGQFDNLSFFLQFLMNKINIAEKLKFLAFASVEHEFDKPNFFYPGENQFAFQEKKKSEELRIKGWSVHCVFHYPLSEQPPDIAAISCTYNFNNISTMFLLTSSWC